MKFLIIFLIYFLSICQIGFAQNVQIEKLDIEPLPQLTEQWCWATCIQMLLSQKLPKSNVPKQCKIANQWLENCNCEIIEKYKIFKNYNLLSEFLSGCVKPLPPSENILSEPKVRFDQYNSILSNLFEKYNFKISSHICSNNDQTEFDFIKNQIDNGNGLLAYVNGFSHVVVIKGYKIYKESFFLYVNDPWPRKLKKSIFFNKKTTALEFEYNFKTGARQPKETDKDFENLPASISFNGFLFIE